MGRDNSVLTMIIACMQVADRLLSMNGFEKKELVMQQMLTNIGETEFNNIGKELLGEIIDLICALTKNSQYLDINSIRRCCPFM